MRTIYFLIILFLVACIACAEVYIYQVKGIGFFQAPAISSALWIIELLLMLLVACLIGLAIGWQLREGTVTNQSEEIVHHEREKKLWVEKIHRAEEEIILIQNKLSHAQESFRIDFKTQAHEKDKLKENQAALQNQLEASQEELSRLQKKMEEQQREVGLSVDSNALLKNNLEKAQSEIENLRSKMTKSFTLPPKDDLKLIAGIGPALEKKLNGLGIYSFRQISEFTPLTIDEVTNAIKFFPGRIERDNWVSQARNFEEEKRRQAE